MRSQVKNSIGTFRLWKHLYRFTEFCSYAKMNHIISKKKIYMLRDVVTILVNISVVYVQKSKKKYNNEQRRVCSATLPRTIR